VPAGIGFSASDSLYRTDNTWFYSKEVFVDYGNKTTVRWFTLVCASEASLPPGRLSSSPCLISSGSIILPPWLTQDRQEAEDLVQET
jgi:hypothetical protein